MKLSDLILMEMNRTRSMGTALIVTNLNSLNGEYGLQAEWFDNNKKDYFDALQKMLFKQLKREQKKGGKKNNAATNKTS